MSDFECTAAIAWRTEALEHDDLTTASGVKVSDTCADAAVKELEQGKIPLIIDRKMPDGSHELWHASELSAPTAPLFSDAFLKPT